MLCVLAASPAGAEIYRWTDAKGRTHFTDRPPDKSRAELLRPEVVTYSGAPVMETLGKVQALAVDQTLRLYGTRGCGHCRRARAYLQKRGVAFTDIDIESSEQAHAEYKRLGGRGVPMFIKVNRKMSGFNPESMEAFLAGAGS